MRQFTFFLFLSFALFSSGQGLKKVYDERIDPMAQIDQAVKKATAEGKHVMCQVGGNWCIWCLRFADFVEKDSLVGATMSESYRYVHVNYNPTTPQGKAAGQKVLQRLGNCGRFGFPVFVVLDDKGRVLHIQDSSFLEEGKGYSIDKTIRFLKSWTPQAVTPDKQFIE